jgi:hypothetical protein
MIHLSPNPLLVEIVVADKKRWDDRMPLGEPIHEEDNVSFLLDEDGNVLEYE